MSSRGLLGANIRLVALFTAMALVLSLVTPSLVLADHDPFGGYVFGPNEKLEGHGAPHVGLCHSLDGENYQHLNVPVSSVLVGQNAHGTNHEFDIVPPFHYDLDKGEGEQSFPGNLWTAENIEFLINDCEEVAPPPPDPVYSISGTKINYDTQLGIPGWTIFLDNDNDGFQGPGEPSTLTDEFGNYDFSGLTAGEYYVREFLEPNWVPVQPDTGMHHVIITDSDLVDVDFVNQLMPEPTYAIPGFKFEDLDGDGIWDDGEVGLEGWRIFVDQNDNGTYDDGEPTAVTDATGEYLLAGLVAGTYEVWEEQQTGWTQTFPEGGSHSVTVGPDIQLEDVNFGNQEDAVVPTELTLDVSKYGQPNPEQPQLISYDIDWSVTGTGTLFNAVVTDFMPAGTTYVFGDGVESGGEVTFDLGDIVADDSGLLNFVLSIDAFGEANHWASFVHSFTQGLQGDGDPVDLNRSDPNQALGEAEDDDTINFVALGFGGTLELGWEHFIVDGPGDDIRIFETSFGDPADEDYPETVEVYVSQNGSDWTLVDTVVLDATVDISSSGLSWVKYVRLVDVSDPNDFESGDADGFDVDGVYAINFLPNLCEIENTVELTGWTEAEGGDQLTTSFTHTLEVNPYACEPVEPDPTYSIFGAKFNDADGDGQWGDNEVGLEGWTIFIDANDNGVLDEGETSGLTDADGNYVFTDLAAGSYIIREAGQSGWTQTYPEDNHTVDLSNGSVDGVNFGNQFIDEGGGEVPTGTGSISGLVFNDANKNGSYDEGETPLNGWTVYLDLDEDDTLSEGDISTTTNTAGEFVFNNLPDGTYYVREVLQDDWTLVYPAAEDDSEYVVTISGGVSIVSLSSAPFIIQAVVSDGTDVQFANFLEESSGSGPGGGGGTNPPPEGPTTPEEVAGEQDEAPAVETPEVVLGDQDETLPAAGPSDWIAALIAMAVLSLMFTGAANSRYQIFDLRR